MKKKQKFNVASMIWFILLLSGICNQKAFSVSWPFSASIPKQLMTTYMEFQHYPDSADPDPYLHDGLDIMAPAQSKVQSIQNGVVRYAYFMGKNNALCWKKAGEPPAFVGEKRSKRYEFVIIEDMQGEDVAWMYGHVFANDFTIFLGKENPVGITVNEGEVLTRIRKWNRFGHPHLHLGRIKKKAENPQNPWTNYCPLVGNPLVYLNQDNQLPSDPTPVLIDKEVISLDPDEWTSPFRNDVPFPKIPSSLAGTIPGAPETGIYAVAGQADIIAKTIDYYGTGPWSQMEP